MEKPVSDSILSRWPLPVFILSALFAAQISFALPVTDVSTTVREVPKVKRTEESLPAMASESASNTASSSASESIPDTSSISESVSNTASSSAPESLASPGSAPPEPVVPAEPEPDFFSDKTLKNTFFLYRLQEDLKDAQDDYRGLSSAVSSTRKKLDKTQEEILTLKEQVVYFNDQIDKSEKKILNVADQIALKEQELEKLSDEIDARKIALADQKNLLSSYLKMQYVQENLFFEERVEEAKEEVREVADEGDAKSTEEGAGKGVGESPDFSATHFSAAKILLADQSVGDTVQNLYTVSLFQEAASQMLDKLDSDMRLLEGMQLNLENKKKRLDSLKEKLQGEQDRIQEQKFAKAILLQQTRGNEERYQSLIAESLRQQEEALLEIRALQDNMRYVQRKLRDFGGEIDLADLKNLAEQRTKEFYEYQLLTDANAEFQWPVSPSRGISAFFRDAAYRARFGIPHNAVDIPVVQGMPVRAAKDGYVYKVKDNGMGYSYIILSHKDQFTTVYGHMSEILVVENAFVKAGEVIGLSGGTPGTKGAGYLTTGAHVHFEILKEGRYLDPLDYLSLTRLTLEQLPEKYVRKIEDQQRSGSVLPEGETEPVSRERLPELLEEAERREHEVLKKEQPLVEDVSGS